MFTTDSLLTLLHRGAEVITERFPCGENRRLWITTKAATGEPEAAFEDPYGDQAVTLAFSRISRASAAVSDGVLPTFTPAASSASFFAWAVPDEPETMAPA